MTSAKIRPIISFFGPRMQTLSHIMVSLKPINLKILPDGTIYLKSHPRKWIQIQIRMHGPEFNLVLQILKVIAGKHTFKMKIFRTPYSSSRLDVSILLYESLKTLQ